MAESKPKPTPGTATTRLPDGAKFAVVYDATQMQWTGTLTIGAQVFTDAASGLHKLLSQLDRQYRQTLEGAPAK